MEFCKLCLKNMVVSNFGAFHKPLKLRGTRGQLQEWNYFPTSLMDDL